MANLNLIEQECEDVLLEIMDLMGPGKRKMPAYEHTELMNRVSTAAHHLINKRLGCPTGKHRDYCKCEEEKRAVTTV